MASRPQTPTMTQAILVTVPLKTSAMTFVSNKPTTISGRLSSTFSPARGSGSAVRI
jgi:hypothetical protein